jgi:hypothetical protein
MLVTVYVAPKGRNSVDVFAAFGITKHHAMSGFNNEDVILHPILHLRERMPDVLFI